MRTSVLTALFVTVLVIVIAFTFTSPLVTLTFNVGVAFAQQPAITDKPVLAQDTPKRAAETKQVSFLKDLDKILKEGCDSFYKFLGWEKYDPPSLVCIDSASTGNAEDTTKFIFERGGT